MLLGLIFSSGVVLGLGSLFPLRGVGFVLFIYGFSPASAKSAFWQHVSRFIAFLDKLVDSGLRCFRSN